MKAFIALCALFAVAQAHPGRIVGGEDAAPGQFPHQASLRSSGNSHFCGATVISKRTLATAAHCKVYDEDSIIVVLGTNELNDNNAKRYKVKSFIIHEDYDASSIINDVAVVILTEDIETSDLVRAVPLASRAPRDGERLTSSGWGLTSYPSSSLPNALQWMQMNVVNSRTCRNSTSQTVTGKICTLESPGHGICSGDSGGPLINDDGELVGITSAAYLCALGMPDFFTDVYYFRDWILERVE